MDALLQSEALTLQKFNAKQDRIATNFGYGDTVGAMAICRAYLQRLSSSLPQFLSEARALPATSDRGQVSRLIEKLDPDVVSLCALSSTLGLIARGASLTGMAIQIGRAIALEAFAANLLKSDKALATRINQAVSRKHGSLKYRQNAASAIAARAGYQREQWSQKQYAVAGGVLLRWVLETLPEVFVTEQDGDKYTWITVSPEALELAEAAVEICIQRQPIFLPSTEPPKPWTGSVEGGYWDKRSRLRAEVVRTFHKDAKAAVRGAIHSGTLKPHLDGLNSLQGTAWKINTRILELVTLCAEEGMTVSGIPARDPKPAPDKPCAWDDMSDDEKRLWRHRASKIEDYNRSLVGNRVLFAQDMKTASLLAESPEFFTPMNCDWRGRVYGVPHFNFQRDDRVRALFLFANGEPLGEDGLYWLKVHVANCGDFEKVSKQPFGDRVAWVDRNLERILECTNHPLSSTAKSFWTAADTPFLFIAACWELAAALKLQNPSDFITHLPVSFDGSCSGLQHLCAMTRAPEGSLVNLTPSPTPQDVYQTVATKVEKAIRADVDGDDADRRELARLCLAYGIGRSLVKRNVMTYAYSSKKYGMAKQQDEDLIGPLEFAVLAGDLAEHPFGRFAQKAHENATSPAALYLAEKIYAAIQATVNLPEQAMVFLQKCARALAHEGKALSWTTPTGLPWMNIYRTPNVKRVKLWLHNTQVTVSIADGTTANIEKDKAANGVAPNFVHALDASHLMLTVNAAVQEGITSVATVHDSFGCLASRAGRFRNIIREQFVAMYEEHDVLAEALAQAKHDLTVHNSQRLPEDLEHGSLDIRDVLSAPYAFA